jgi:serine O-acetyltransferase
MSARIETLKIKRVTTPVLDLAPVVEALRESRENTHNIRQDGKVIELPSSLAILDVLQGIITSLFPTHLGPQGLNHENIDIFVANSLSTALTRLSDQIARSLQFNLQNTSSTEARCQAERITRQFGSDLPHIRALLVSDLKAAQLRDPSAESLSEILICYRSSTAILYYRLAHALYQRGASLVARMVSDLAHASTGIDIHPAARIGPGFFISRGTGVVIGETSVIGENVCLHQGVTLGEAEFIGDAETPVQRRASRHPVIENNVVIHSGATLLGRITIGAGSVVHSNVSLSRSIPPGSIVRQASLQHGEVSALR